MIPYLSPTQNCALVLLILENKLLNSQQTIFVKQLKSVFNEMLIWNADKDVGYIVENDLISVLWNMSSEYLYLINYNLSLSCKLWHWNLKLHTQYITFSIFHAKARITNMSSNTGFYQSLSLQHWEMQEWKKVQLQSIRHNTLPTNILYKQIHYLQA